MTSFIRVAVLSAVTSLCALAVVPPALAQVGISLNFGDVAVGYQDGYYDSHHHWHHWAHPNDYQAYSRAHPEHYHAYTHDRDEPHH
ncbi:MAG TPA: hypothetical protein VMD53_18195 [Rhizomicrobium sp.]|nr:hypothetical protein [Rhizomicrobium sp.]